MYPSSARHGVTDGTVPSGSAPNTFTPDFYISPTGSAFATGSISDPFRMQDAFAGASGAVRPDETGGVMDGLYSGSYAVSVSGTTGHPIRFRSLAGARPVLDSTANDGTSTLVTSGHDIEVWGLETTCSDTTRISTNGGADFSHPTDVPRQSKGFRNTGYNVKLVACVAHDGGNGFANQSEDTAHDTEDDSNLAYNNGWIGPDRGHGHNTYLQNLTGRKTFRNGAYFDSFDDNFNLFGQSADLVGIDAFDNAIFNGGGPSSPTFPYARNIGVVGGVQQGDCNFDGNSVFHIDGNRSNMIFGSNGDGPSTKPFSFTNNICQGSSEINNWLGGSIMTGNMIADGVVPYTGAGQRLVLIRTPTGVSHGQYTWDRNQYAYIPSVAQPVFFFLKEGGVSNNFSALAALQAAMGYELNGSLIATAFPDSTVRYKPSKYLAGRGLIHVHNWNAASSVLVNPSTILSVGDSYRIRHIYDWAGRRGLTSYTGVYSGASVSLGMTGWTAETPIGMASPPASTAPYFNVFLCEKTN